MLSNDFIGAISKLEVEIVKWVKGTGSELEFKAAELELIEMIEKAVTPKPNCPTVEELKALYESKSSQDYFANDGIVDDPAPKNWAELCINRVRSFTDALIKDRQQKRADEIKEVVCQTLKENGIAVEVKNS